MRIPTYGPAQSKRSTPKWPKYCRGCAPAATVAAAIAIALMTVSATAIHCSDDVYDGLTFEREPLIYQLADVAKASREDPGLDVVMKPAEQELPETDPSGQSGVIEETAQEPQQAVNETTASADASAAESGARAVPAGSMEVPEAETGFKAYMDYRAITSKSSTQYKMQQEAWTDELGFRRYGDYYMVAMGTFYGGCGSTYHIVLEYGGEFDVILGDVKSDQHTNAGNQHRNGNVLEFIIDKTAVSQECLNRGDMSYAAELFAGKITAIYPI